MEDIFTVMHPKADEGAFILDLTGQKRSMGYVMHVSTITNMMRVRFPKVNRDDWVVWKNHGHYRVIEK